MARKREEEIIDTDEGNAREVSDGKNEKVGKGDVDSERTDEQVNFGVKVGENEKEDNPVEGIDVVAMVENVEACLVEGKNISDTVTVKEVGKRRGLWKRRPREVGSKVEEGELCT